MTQYDSNSGRPFVANVLPWLLGAMALIAYLLTINPWVSLINMPQVAKVSGWSWSPDISGPAYYLATLPLRLLPMRWVPLGLNIFSAVCGALALVQLARSVAILPHDRTQAQRLRESSESSTLSIPLAWLPPLLAILVCGFQLTFWENATNGTPETFDLLLFACIVRALLEFRLDHKESRLWRASLLMGIGMTNNAAMIGFLPFFMMALVWMRGLRFFNLGFLMRMALFGLSGLLLYLLLPLLANLASEPVGFWLALKANIGAQKNLLLFYPKKTLAVLALTSLVPLLLIAFRWPSRFGDNSPLGSAIATGTFHLIHFVLLVVCIWIAFDPPVSPRNRGGGYAFLPLYYLGAMSIGYFAGYFLLVFRSKMGRTRVFSPGLQNAERTAITIIFALLVVVVLGLPARNLSQIRLTNGPIVKNFAASLAAGLPGGGVVLSDDSRRLLLVESWLARTGDEKDYLFLDTQSLRWPPYHRHLAEKYPGRWEPPSTNDPVEMFDASRLIGRLLTAATNKPLYYLHPSFGYYFELFYPEARGIIYEMKRFQPAKLLPPKPDAQNITLNQNFWNEAEEKTLLPIVTATEPRSPEKEATLLERIFEKFRLKPESNAQCRQIAMYYSRALNYWGVEIQKLGRLEEAAEHFQLALRLNPDNVVAEVNLQSNEHLRAGESKPITFSKNIEESLGKYRSLEHVLNDNGPYDEPSLSYAQAWVFLRGKLYREAAQWLERVRDFSPNDLSSRLILAQISLMANEPSLAMELVGEIRSNPDRFPLNSTNRADLMSVEASAYFAVTNNDAGNALLAAALQSGDKDDYLLSSISTLYLQRREFENALNATELRLKLNPTNATALINRGYIQIQQENYEGAILTFTQVIDQDSANTIALMNRAIACLRAGRLEDAQRDYDTLDVLFPNQFQIQYGLGEIAWLQKNTNAAIRHYQKYLTNSPRGSIEAKVVAGRLDQLLGGDSK